MLLRGANVGGHNWTAMADLRALLTGIGCEQMRAYLQSGNAVVESPRSGSALERAVGQVLAARGLPVAS